PPNLPIRSKPAECYNNPMGSTRDTRRQVVLYSRPGCHLCEDAAELLERMAQRMPIAIVEINILGDADLYERYKHSIPVVAIDGRPALAAPIRADELERILIEP
ncbi:MAG TPA: glutaredoxin family protein, partial [Roseiflexaceae bacterium]|nr:glutaredoxin family protein [Roseiflexaceae bacterium]